MCQEFEMRVESDTGQSPGSLPVELVTEKQHAGKYNSGTPEEKVCFLREGVEQSRSGEASQKRCLLGWALKKITEFFFPFFVCK